ncbi:MAG TPA: PmoA family protein [Chloroflexota bacterium]
MTRTLAIAAGRHDRRDCPLWFDPPDGAGETFVMAGDGDRGYAAQRAGAGAFLVVDEVAAGQTLRLRPTERRPREGGLSLAERGDALEIGLDGRSFATYRFGAGEPRPYFYPLHGPSGRAMTRGYPMVPDSPDESHDHPHHRGLMVAFGEVNGVDCWSELGGHGRIEHVAWERRSVGPAGVDLVERLRWTGSDGRPLLDERRRLTLYATSGVRLIDLEIALGPAGFAVLLGDTKEGGPLAIRVPSPIEGRRGGRIANAQGGVGEAETWGKRSAWVDYAGVIEGEEVGVALFDHPTSFRHPTHWHVRDYGLFCPNPFGRSAFTGDPGQRGDHVLGPGEQVVFRYRVCLHAGPDPLGQARARYCDYAYPPTAIWE